MRPEKSTIVDDLTLKVQASPYLILIEYGGMNVLHFSELRQRLATAGASCSVVKNSFLKRSMKDAGVASLAEHLTGQTAIVIGERDICAAAKALKTFAAEFTKPVLRAGILDNEILSVDQIMELAALPSKEALQAQLLGVLMAPGTKLVRTLAEPGTSLARLLSAKLAA
ncbi:MAG: 50S ribosomal protein L10 [Verrucomicrobia bacterium RIFCSPHIGHO2_12_FULL_41_10]|nr:MAG: 50S ribosomal protein L10 [Verrucomicrobia bacterium RIFCSPHIGHO2_12_FULL_41_10]HLB33657.1 50S ribosomal protein L10 [Chthoniobacterales bacterium]